MLEEVDQSIVSNDTIEEAPPKNKKRIFLEISLKIIGFLLGIIILWLLIRWSGGVGFIWETLTNIAWWIFVVAILIYTCDWVFRGWRWLIIVSSLDIKLSLLNSIELTLIGNTFNLLLPAKLGDSTRIIGLNQKTNATITDGFSAVLADRFLDLGAVVFFIVLCLPFVGFSLFTNNASIGIYISISIVTIGILGILLLYLIRRKLTFDKLPVKLRNFLNNFLDSILLVFKYRPFFQILFSLIIWILESVIAYLFIRNLLSNTSISFFIITFAIMIGNLTKALPITPGGIGAYEATFSGILSTTGIPIDICVTVALIDHLFKNIYTIIFGLLSYSHIGINRKKKNND